MLTGPSKAQEIIGKGHMRIADKNNYPFGGAAPTNPDTERDWFVLTSSWFVYDGYYQSHVNPNSGTALQGAIAHEMDHLLLNHAPGVTGSDGHLLSDSRHTLNSASCDGTFTL